MNDRTHTQGTERGTDGFDSTPGVTSEIARSAGIHGAEDAVDSPRELLLEVVRRAPILRALQQGPAAASDIVPAVDLSRSTVHRATDSLEDAGLVEQTGDGYRLTNLGRLTLEEVQRFGTQTTTAMALSPFLNTISVDGEGFPVEHFVNATITRRRPRQPHATIHRIIELIEASEHLRMFSTVLSPFYVDVGYREMMDGMEIEGLFEPELVDIMLSEFPEKARKAFDTGNFDVYRQQDLPFELFIFDDRMGMAAHNERGNAEVLVECADPAAVEWAESVYEEYHSTADPLDVP